MEFLKALASAFEHSDLRCVGVGVMYGSKDSGGDEDDVFNLKPEYIAVFTPKSDAIAFANREITEEDLMEKADVFLKTRDMTDVKKIRLAAPK